ncbi:hypothetical protein [Mariniphaga anaerophila]|uniref:hypothetical protein n=1 Tax=Mariniphaga anaerophila TaxID=1484053 RepID=UPI000932C894|nr:hypothetical protein [Mariniphaga anaerophila]
MKLIRNISVFFFCAIFLVSATGIVVFHSHCSCTGNDQVSIYVSPETCEENFHRHHTHNEGGEEELCSAEKCHECSEHTHSCGCDAPEVQFFKIDNQIATEKVRIENIQVVQLFMYDWITLLPFFSYECTTVSQINYAEPPPLKTTSLDFLIYIQQLKIPEIA